MKKDENWIEVKRMKDQFQKRIKKEFENKVLGLPVEVRARLKGSRV